MPTFEINCNKIKIESFFYLKTDFYRYKNIFCNWKNVDPHRSERDIFDEAIRILKFPFSRKLC